MNISLAEYHSRFREETIERIVRFFGFHCELRGKNSTVTEKNYTAASQTLCDWISDGHELYVIEFNGRSVGFLHIGYRGGNVAWIEDIFVDEIMRRKGIATETIKIAEELIKSKPDYTAICLDVVPRNIAALRLYHKLGYDCLGLITVRKELCEHNRDQTEKVFGLEFKY
ncbi:MAG TPA: GNAT family N-acetyltransferase [Oscillospiraceae bacterium]|nr:GNAT family N-acetyltransferase [Oscillospiraceae bacterium]HPF56674.1 GNAT family N-acetyltransferase [Clostridiales bacterium]HPK36560.1 GNAT family N-acetyltransferase [Oscillospiraceae bacterium]HPR76642.1 GNAT family N-acetyltransferase [Oscillospiraceae bacterium]